MELRQLTYFEAVARCGGFSRAAEELHIAQPAISVQIKNLEREVGAELFRRTTRRVTLTEAGERLLLRAVAILREVDHARDELEGLGQTIRGRLRIGVTPVLGALDLAALLSGYHRRFPDVDVRITSGTVKESLVKLDDGEVDALLAPLHPRLPKRLITHPLVSERIVLVTPPGRLPARPAHVALSVLRGDVFVCLPEGTALNSILTSAARAQGFTPRIRFRVPDPQTIRRFVAAGLGVALLAESVAHEEDSEIDVVRLRPSPQHPPIGIIYHHDRPLPAAGRAWVEHVISAVAAR